MVKYTTLYLPNVTVKEEREGEHDYSERKTGGSDRKDARASERTQRVDRQGERERKREREAAIWGKTEHRDQMRDRGTARRGQRQNRRFRIRLSLIRFLFFPSTVLFFLQSLVSPCPGFERTHGRQTGGDWVRETNKKNQENKDERGKNDERRRNDGKNTRKYIYKG